MAAQRKTNVGYRNSMVDGRPISTPIFSYSDAPSSGEDASFGSGWTSTKKTSTPKSNNYTISKTTSPQTTTRTTTPKTTTGSSSSSWTPTQAMPTYGGTVRASLPDAPVLPTLQAPTLGTVDPYAAPEYDLNRVSSLTQQFAAPGVRTLRQGLREATSRRFDNPNVGALTMRQALQGYGTGLSAIMGGAAKTAGEEYGREYGVETDEAKINYTQAVNDRNAIFNADMTSASMNFQATIDNIKMVFGAKVAQEIQYAADQNAQNSTIFSAAMDAYLKTGVSSSTSTSTTTGGDETITTLGGTETTSRGPYQSSAELDYQAAQKAYTTDRTIANWRAVNDAQRRVDREGSYLYRSN